MPSEKPFSSLGLTEAVTAFLHERPGQFFTPVEIGKGLIGGGFVPASPHYLIMIYTLCRRKAWRRAYAVMEKSGRWVYGTVAKPQSSALELCRSQHACGTR